MANCKERKSLPTMLKVLKQNCVFYRIKIQGTILKQPVRIEYVIKQKPRDGLALQVNRLLTEGSHRRDKQLPLLFSIS